MKRQVQLLILTHLYGLFAVWHLCLAPKCMLVIVLSHEIPNGILVLFVSVLAFNKWFRLSVVEKSSCGCLVTLALFYHAYIAMCGIVSNKSWVWHHNIESGVFIGITLLFYSITIYKLKREYKR